MRPPRKSGYLIVVNKGLRPSPGRHHNSSIMLLNLQSGEVEKTFAAREGPHEVSVSPDGRVAVIPNYGGQAQEDGIEAGGGNSLSVLDLKKRGLSHIDLDGYFRPHGVEWLDKSRVAITVDGTQKSIRQGYVLVVNVAEKRVEQSIPTGQPGSHLVKLSPDGKRLFVTNIQGQSLTVIGRNPGREKRGSPWSSARAIRTIRTGEGAEGIDLHPRKREVWVGNQQDNTITVIDRRSLEKKRTISVKGGPIRVRFTPNGEQAVVSLRAGNALAVLDAATGKEIRRIPFEVPSISEKGPERGKTSTPMMVEFHRKSPHIAYVGNSHSRLISVVDLRKGKVVGYYKAGDKPDPLAWVPGSN